MQWELVYIPPLPRGCGLVARSKNSSSPLGLPVLMAFYEPRPKHASLWSLIRCG